MPFTFKLSKRLARMRVWALVVSALAPACELPSDQGVTAPGVPAPVVSVTVSPASLTLTVGNTQQLSSVLKDVSGNVLTGRAVAWTSSNPALVTVSGGGLATAVAAGSATITATSEGKNGTAGVAVTDVPVASVAVSPASASLTTGQTVPLTATPKDASGNPLSGRVVTWASSNTPVATVTGSGLVTGVAAGSATITATSEGQRGTASVTVANVPVASVMVSPAAATVTVGQSVPLTATPKDANGDPLSGRVVTWASSAPAVATVNGSGLVSGVAVGAATLTATSEGVSGTAAITVTALPPPSVGWPNEPAGFTLVNDYNLGSDPVPATSNASSLGASGWAVQWNPDGNGSASSDGGAPLSPLAVYQVKYPTGFTSGGIAPSTLILTFPASGELYFGYWWKPSNPWQGHDSGVNKISFCVSGDFSNEAIVSMLGSGSGPFHVRLYITGTYLTNNVNNPTVALGVWHRIEVYINRATRVARLWMDGVLLADHNTAPFGGTLFDTFEFSPTWGGVGGANKTETDYYWFDHVHISRR